MASVKETEKGVKIVPFFFNIFEFLNCRVCPGGDDCILRVWAWCFQILKLMRRVFGKRHRKKKTSSLLQEHTEPLRCVVRNELRFGVDTCTTRKKKKKRLKMMNGVTSRKTKKFKELSKEEKEQTFLDFGQSNFGSKTCEICGMIYSPGKPEDERLHDSYCEKKSKPIGFRSKRTEEFVVFKDLSRDVQVWRFQKHDCSTCKYIADKYVQVKKVMDTSMGFGQAGSSSAWTAYFYVKKHVVAGCVIVEMIENAYKLLSKDSYSIRTSKTVVPARMGIVQLWVDKRYRRQGIAKSLIDNARKHTIYGSVIRKSECAMTQPTRDGRAFGECYFGVNDLLVYT